MLDHDALQSLIAFAEHLNLTHAARALHLSQPALHARLHRLAEQVGAPLYARQGRRMALTPAGEEVLAFARRTHEETQRLLARLHGHDPLEPVTLAAGEGALLYLLAEPIAAFTRAREAPLRLLTTTGPETVEAVRTGLAHLGVAALGDGVAPDLSRVHLRRVGQRLILPQHHPLSLHPSPDLADLHGHALIVPPPGRPHRQHIADHLDAAGVAWTVAVEASGWETMLRFASLGVGLAIVNDLCPTPPGCVARPLPQLGARSYHLLHRRDAAPAGYADALRRCILGATAAQAP